MVAKEFNLSCLNLKVTADIWYTDKLIEDLEIVGLRSKFTVSLPKICAIKSCTPMYQSTYVSGTKIYIQSDILAANIS